MKKYFTLSHLMTLIIIIVVALLQGPALLNNLSHTGAVLSLREYQALDRPEVITFPPPQQKALAIFWATWCGPCKIEMARLKASIEKGKIPQDAVFAINAFEDQQVIRKFLAKTPYPFTFIEAPEVKEKLNIQLTPTTIFLDNGEVTSMSSGMSLIGIWRAEYFLK